MTTTLAVANQKGGVAKTTTVASLGAALAELGHRVLLVDLDPQACLTFSLGLDPEALELSVHDVLLGRVAARPWPSSRPTTASTCCPRPSTSPAPRPTCSRGPAASTSCARRSTRSAPSYDLVLLDCPPSLGVLTLNALTAADEVLIPLQCETLSHRGVGQLLDTDRATCSKRTNRDLRGPGRPARRCSTAAPTTPARCSPTSRVRYGLAVLEPPIPKSVRFAEAPGRRSVRAGDGADVAAAPRPTASTPGSSPMRRAPAPSP